jgi:hypothetical protein
MLDQGDGGRDGPREQHHQHPNLALPPDQHAGDAGDRAGNPVHGDEQQAGAGADRGNSDGQRDEDREHTDDPAERRGDANAGRDLRGCRGRHEAVPDGVR